MLRAVLLIALFAGCLTAPGEVGAQASLDQLRSVEIAQLKLRLYERVEYPAELRRLEADWKVAEAEVESLERLQEEYAPFDKFSTGRALAYTVEATKLGLLRAQLNRDELKRQLTTLKRFHSDRLRLLRLELEQARVFCR